MAELQNLEVAAGETKEAYKESMQELQDVSLQQSAILGELVGFEDSLDMILPEFMSADTKGYGSVSKSDNKFVKLVM